MFGNHRTVHFGGIREYNVTFDQLWKLELMHSSRGTVNPAQFLAECKLFRTQGKGKDDFGVAQVFFHSLVGTTLHDVEFWKFRGQTLSEPSRYVPKVEMVMDNDQKLHGIGKDSS